MRLILVTCLLLLAVPAVAGAQTGAPVAMTGEATDVARTAATLHGTVDPNLTLTTYRFEYGTTKQYGSATAPKDAGDGDDPVPVEDALTGLAPDTTYHYRLVADNPNGTSPGEDATFHTPPNPRAPGVSRTGTAQTGPDSAIVRSTIVPHGVQTTYRFEYGRTRSFGSRTPDRTLPAGEAGTDVTEQLAGLQPFRRYHFRLVATNSAGTSRSLTHSFVTARRPTAITLDVDGRTPWGEGIEVFGRVSGSGINGIPVGLERQEFDFTGPFSSVGTPFPVRADGSGRFRIFVPSLFASTRLRAITHTSVQVVSPPVTAPVSVRVGIVRRLSRKRARIRGSVQPAVPNGRATLQRRSTTGRWTYVKGKGLTPLGESRSRYSFSVKRSPKRNLRYRVRVIARDGGAHWPGRSRAVRVPKVKKQRR